jgi:serine/threonine protein kinase
MENITSDTKRTMELFYNNKIDIWSYGICIYELVFNILPFSNIHNIDDLISLYNSDDIQQRIHQRINDKNMISDDFKTLLCKMLTVDTQNRCCINDVIQQIQVLEHIYHDNQDLNDLINMNEHAYLKNEKMKEHVIKAPLETQGSWEKINKSTSVIMNMSIQKGFLNWLLGK